MQAAPEVAPPAQLADGAHRATCAAHLRDGAWAQAMQLLRRFPALVIDLVDEAQRTPLHLAVLIPQLAAPALAPERLSFVRELLELPSASDAQRLCARIDGDGNTALDLAMQTMDESCDVSKSVVRALVMQGISPPAQGPESARQEAQLAYAAWRDTLSTLLGAAESGNMALINRTIRHKDAEDFNFDSTDPEGLTCLHLAAMHCQAEASRVLLASGADPNVADGAGHTSLHYLCHTFEERRVDASVLRDKGDKDREGCAEALLSFGADINATDVEGHTCLFYACRNAIAGMIRGLILNGGSTTIGESEGSLLDRIVDPSLRASAQGFLEQYIADKQQAEAATPPEELMGQGHFDDAMDDDMEMEGGLGEPGMGMGMGMGFGGVPGPARRSRRRRREVQVVPFSSAVPDAGAGSGLVEQQLMESSSDEEVLPVRPIGRRSKWGDSDDDDSDASTPGLTEEELADMSEVDDDASEVSYADSSEVEYEVDSDEDCHFAASDSDEDADLEDEDPNQEYTAELLRNPVGRRTIREYGFRPIHADTLWKMRDKGLRDVMAEFGIPRSAAAAVMQKFEWDMQEARKGFRKAGEMPDDFLNQARIEYDVSESVVKSDGTSLFCPVDMEETTQWTALGFCMCKFSDVAWKGYFESHIESADVVGLKCMSERCNVLAPEEFVESMVSPAHQTRYRRFLAETYVKDQTAKNTVKFCPAPDCGHAMDARKATVAYEDTPVTVRCICKYEFCYRCQSESHAPASCEEVREWNKRFTDDVETQQYLNTFCKPCPTKDMIADFLKAHPKFRFHTTGEYTKQHGCGRMIYKDKGCNHMWACPCGFHWCWQCGGPYYGTEEVTVNGNTSRMEYHNDFFNCKNVDQKKIEAEVGEEARKLDRWKQISDLYATQLNAEKGKQKVIAEVHKMCDEMRRTEGFGDANSRHFSEGDCAELLAATNSMFESRRVVKFTYVREFLLEKKIFRLEEQFDAEMAAAGDYGSSEQQEHLDELKRELEKFKLWQDPFISAIDRLSEMIERPDAVRLLKPRRERKRMRELTATFKRQCDSLSAISD